MTPKEPAKRLVRFNDGRVEFLGAKKVRQHLGAELVSEPSWKEVSVFISELESRLCEREKEYDEVCKTSSDRAHENASLRRQLKEKEEYLANVIVAYEEQWNRRVRQLSPPLSEGKERPKIVCFCGSSKFIVQMAILMWEFEKQGCIALGLHYMPPQYGEAKGYPANYNHLAEMEGIALDMDELHKRKIDLASEIFVVNVDGYIGSSTRSEIEYAIAHNKPVKYLVPRSPSEKRER